MELALDIMLSLKEMFGEQGRLARQGIMRLILNTKMTQGTPIRDHLKKILSYKSPLSHFGIQDKPHSVLPS